MHRPYERHVTTISDAQGIELTVVRGFRDGIVARDPERLVVYDPNGRIVLETEEYRELIVCPIQGNLYVFALEFIETRFHRGWVLRDRALIPLPLFRGHFGALLASLRKHGLLYGFSVTPLVAGAVSGFSGAGEEINLSSCWLLSMSFVWIVLQLAYGPLSIFLLLSLSLIGSLFFCRTKGICCSCFVRSRDPGSFSAYTSTG